jgi:hypothetical protein
MVTNTDLGCDRRHGSHFGPTNSGERIVAQPDAKAANPRWPCTGLRDGDAYGTQSQVLFRPLIHAPLLAPALVQAAGGFTGGSQSVQ